MFRILAILTILLSPLSAAEANLPAGEEKEEKLWDFIVHHIVNTDSWHPLPFVHFKLPFNHVEVFGVNMGLSLHVLMMFLALTLLSVFLPIASRRSGLAPASKFGHAIEALVIYIKNEIVVPNIGKKDAAKWMPFFLTLFFFILMLNLIGMVPGMSTVTANINFTAAMAFLVFCVFNISGMIKNGPITYFKNLVPHGIPFFVVIILAPIEVIGLLTKSAALAIRLFANISAGHIIILSLLGLVAVLKSWLAPPLSISFTLFISCIEILVAFLQAYVFTLLSSLFVGMAIHQDH
jgi:F-type H+-transporting ATPase subunit a